MTTTGLGLGLGLGTSTVTKYIAKTNSIILST
jgi:hypothetical protein